MRKSALVASAFFVATLFGAPAIAQEPIVIKFSHVVAPDTPKGKGSEKFKELATKYTNGRVKVEIYPNSQLYKDKEELEALQLGAVQMLAPSLAKFGPLGAKEFEVFDLPFIFQDKAALRKITEGPIGKRLLDSLDSKGIIGLAYWDNGFKIMTANKPIKTPDDMLGLKMRIQSSKVLEAEMKAYGAVPQVLAFSEVYQAMQKHATLTNHGYIGYAVIVNKKFWDGLPADVRSGLDKAMAEATTFTNEIAQKENDDAIADIKKAGKTEMYTPTAAEKKLWVEASKPVHKEMSGRVGAKLIEEIYAATGAK